MPVGASRLMAPRLASATRAAASRRMRGFLQHPTANRADMGMMKNDERIENVRLLTTM